MQGNHILGPLLETLQEIHHKISDILSVGGLECKLLIPHSDEGEGLGESFAAPTIRLTLDMARSLPVTSISPTISQQQDQYVVMQSDC